MYLFLPVTVWTIYIEGKNLNIFFFGRIMIICHLLLLTNPSLFSLLKVDGLIVHWVDVTQAHTLDAICVTYELFFFHVYLIRAAYCAEFV